MDIFSLVGSFLTWLIEKIFGKKDPTKAYQKKYVAAEKKATETQAKDDSIEITNKIFDEEAKKQDERKKEDTSTSGRLSRLRNRFKRGGK